MLNPTSGTLADYNNAILNMGQTHVRIVFPVQGITLTDDNIPIDSGIVLTSILNAEEDLIFGNAVTSEIVINLMNNGNFAGFNWSEEFHIDFGVEMNGDTNWVTKGYFTGKRPERIARTDVIEFTAYDRMKKFDGLADEFLETITYPTTMRDIYDDLCAYVGVQNVTGDEIASAMDVVYTENPFVSGVSCKTVLSYIAEANCCYARINAGGYVQLVWFEDHTSDYEITDDDYTAIDLDEASAPVIDAVRISSTQSSATPSIYPVSGYNVPYQIVDNPLMLAMAGGSRTSVITEMLSRFSSLGAYIPVKVDVVGNWMVETGDIITVGYDSTETMNMPVFSRIMVWNGGCSDNYECTGKAERSELSGADRSQYAMGGQLDKKYSIQSGVDITDEGITVSGGKFVKIESGGVLDVQSENFQIDSANKKLVTGNWRINDHGLFWEDSSAELGEIDQFNIGKTSEYINFYMRKKGYGDSYGFQLNDSGSLIPYKNLNIVSGSLGSSSNQWARVYAQRYYGDGIKNDLTTEDAGYVLDARQGKELNDAVLSRIRYKKYFLSSAGTQIHTFTDNSPFLVLITRAGVTTTGMTGIYAGNAGTSNGNVIALVEPTAATKPTVTISGKTLSITTVASNTNIVVLDLY